MSKKQRKKTKEETTRVEEIKSEETNTEETNTEETKTISEDEQEKSRGEQINSGKKPEKSKDEQINSGEKSGEEQNKSQQSQGKSRDEQIRSAEKQDKAGGKRKKVKEVQEKSRNEQINSGQEQEKNVETQKKSGEDESMTGETAEKPAKSGGKAKWVVLASVLVLAMLLSVGYVGMARYYRTHFLPGSTVNGMDCSNMEAVEIAELVDAEINTYCLKVWGRDYATEESSVLVGEITPGEISLSYIDSLGGVEDMLARQNEWEWIKAYIAWNFHGDSLYGHALSQGVKFDEDKLKAVVNSWEACMEKNMQKPQDAYISEYSDEIGGYQIIPETMGTTLNMDRVLKYISSTIYEERTNLDLEETFCYYGASVTHTSAKLIDIVDTANTWLGTKITYDWNGNEVLLDIETLKEWIAVEESGPVLDEEAVKSFVREQAKKYNTFGKKKKFVTALGIELTLDSPNYGWRTDSETETEELIQLIYQGSVTEREPVYSVKAKQKGFQDIGGNYIEADLTHQHLYVFQNGERAFETDFVSGMTNIVPSRATPAGIFGLTYKTRNATLRGADYESFVNYWMPFYGNYGMHDATWRQDFGGTIYQNHGSHGCINLPLDSAAVIYEYVSAGFPVICYYYEVDPLGPPAETQMPSEEELRMQEEPVINRGEEAGQDQEAGQNQ